MEMEFSSGNKAAQLDEIAKMPMQKMRILLASDIHNGSYNGQGLTYSQRMDLLVSKINEENKTKPLDCVLLLGDLSHNDLTLPSFDSLADLVGNKLSKLDVPFYCVHGSHDYYTETQWKNLLGYSKRYSLGVGDYIFLCVDNYGDSVNTVENSGFGYTKIDSTWLSAQLMRYADKKIILCGHYFDTTKEDAETLDLLSSAKNIICAFEGHVHDYIYRQIANTGITAYRTGNFAYPPNYDWTSANLWGYRIIEVLGADVVTFGVKIAHSYDLGVQEREELSYTTVDELSQPNNPPDIFLSTKEAFSKTIRIKEENTSALGFISTFTNAIKNSIFVRGVFGWGTTNATISIVEGRLVSTGTGGGTTSQTNYDTDITAQNKTYYVSTIVSSPDSIPVNAEIRIQGSTGGGSILVGNKSNPTANVAYQISEVVKTDSTHLGFTRLLFRGNYANTTVANGARLALENPMVVDITSLPSEKKTKAWCDANLRYRI